MLDAMRIALSEHPEVTGVARAPVRASLLKVDIGDLSLSVLSALVVSPNRRRLRIFFAVHPENHSNAAGLGIPERTQASPALPGHPDLGPPERASQRRSPND
jgi:hypothetical protein